MYLLLKGLITSILQLNLDLNKLEYQIGLYQSLFQLQIFKKNAIFIYESNWPTESLSPQDVDEISFFFNDQDIQPTPFNPPNRQASHLTYYGLEQVNMSFTELKGSIYKRRRALMEGKMAEMEEGMERVLDEWVYNDLSGTMMLTDMIKSSKTAILDNLSHRLEDCWKECSRAWDGLQEGRGCAAEIENIKRRLADVKGEAEKEIKMRKGV
jgi:hypothetical protein